MSESIENEGKSATHEEMWESAEGIKSVADFLRGRKGMKVRQAVELGKRVEFFRGDKLVSFLMESSSNAKHCPTISDKNQAISVGKSLVRFGYIHRSERDPKNKKILTPCREHTFVLTGYYTWMYDGPRTIRNFMTAALIVGFLAMTCFPIWPQWAKIGLWYLSVTFLIVMTLFIIIRAFLFFILWMFGTEFWFLPNIFDDDLSVADSFKPLYSLKQSPPSERYYRAAAVVGFAAFSYWVYNQPTEFDEYVSLTKQFTEDIYSGKLLSDMSEKDKEDIDRIKIPALSDLMNDDEHDIFSEKDEEKIFDDYLENTMLNDDEDEDEDEVDDEEADKKTN